MTILTYHGISTRHLQFDFKKNTSEVRPRVDIHSTPLDNTAYFSTKQLPSEHKTFV